MPGKVLPIFEQPLQSDREHTFVTFRGRVFDVHGFLEDHPGGGDVIQEFANKDVETIMLDELSHKHSEDAFEVLGQYVVGRLNPAVTNDSQAVCRSKTGLSKAEELSIPTDYRLDYKTHAFINLNKPLLAQVWNGGFSKEFYLEQIHRPRHYAGGSAPMFTWPILEPLSKTPWWIIPLIWLPSIAYGTFLASAGLSTPTLVSMWCLGLFAWTIVEYGMHRFLFHVDEWMPDNRVSITLHFLLHGVHHFLPMDKMRLVMPPTLFIVLATPFYKLAHLIFSYYYAMAIFSGGIFGYVVYDLTHYFLHHKQLPQFWKELKQYHMRHHFENFELGFGVSSRFWDTIFGTELPPMPMKVGRSNK